MFVILTITANTFSFQEYLEDNTANGDPVEFPVAGTSISFAADPFTVSPYRNGFPQYQVPRNMLIIHNFVTP